MGANVLKLVSIQTELVFVNLTGSSNEGQFAFNVESIVMAQKLRGTLTYVIKVLCCFVLFSVISVPRWRRGRGGVKETCPL